MTPTDNMLEVIKKIAKAKQEAKKACNQIAAYEIGQQVSKLTDELVSLYAEYKQNNNVSKVLYFAVDKDNSAHLFPVCPVRVENFFWDDPRSQEANMSVNDAEASFCGLPTDMTWKDEPRKVTIIVE